MTDILPAKKYGLYADINPKAAGPKANSMMPPPQHEKVVNAAGISPSIPIPGILQLVSILLLRIASEMLSPSELLPNKFGSLALHYYCYMVQASFSCFSHRASLMSTGVNSRRFTGSMSEPNPFLALHSKWYRFMFVCCDVRAMTAPLCLALTLV